MAKVIFILHRRADQTRQQCLEHWRGERHTSIVRDVPGLTRWIQNHANATTPESACDGVGELWFDSQDALEQALSSPQMAAAIEDAKNFLDMEATQMLIVAEHDYPVKSGQTMTTTDLGRTLEEWAAGWSARDIERVVSLCTDECVYEDVPLGAMSRGKQELRAFGHQVFEAFPDFGIELTSQSAEGDRALLEWVMSGTHKGDLPGMPATGKEFSVRGATALELKNGRISRNSDYWDMATLLTQLGLMPFGPEDKP
jgi:steroid delta-isomerase-like uncharacterized protein/uncharacterized protein (TIGR02118 family)